MSSNRLPKSWLSPQQIIDPVGLQASEQFLRSIYQGSAHAIFVVDVLASGEFRYAGFNPAYEQLTGLNSKHIQGKSPEQVLPPDQAAAASANYLRCVQAGTTISYEECLLLEGEDSWWLTSLTPLRNEQSQIYRLIGTSINITDVCGGLRLRKQAEEALRQSEAKFRHIYENAPVMMHSIDENGKICNVNRKWLEETGYTQDEVIGRRTDFLMTPESARRAISTLIPQFWRDGYVRNVPYEYVRKDGTIIDVVLDCNAITDPITGDRVSLSVVRNVTEQKRAEEALRESERKLRAIFDQTYQLMGLLSPEGILLEANQTALNFSRLRREDLINRPFWDTFCWTISPETQQQLQSAIARCAQGEFIRYEVDVWSADKQVITLDFSLRPIKDEVGQVVLIIPEGRDITQPKQVEAALKRQEEFLRYVIDTNPNLIFVKDWDGKFTLANQAFADIYGTTVADIIGKTDADFNPNLTEIEQYLQADRQVMTTLQPKFIPEETVSSPTGEVRWFQTIKKPLLSTEGQSRSVLGVATDITDRKRAEAALQQSEEKFRQLAEQIHSVFWTISADRTQLIYVSPAYEEIWGRPCAELYASPQSFFDAIHPEDRDRIRGALVQQFQGEYDQEYRIVRPNGELRWIHTRAFPVHNQMGQVYRIVGISEDISDRKQVEQALQESEARYRAIVEDQTELICRFLPNGVLTFVNEAYCRYFGKQSEELIGFNFLAFLPDKDRRVFEKYLASLTPENPMGMFEHRVVMPSGDIRWHQWNDRAIFDEAGCLIEFQSVGRDITERKRTEAALGESEAQFRTLVANLPGVVYRCPHSQEWQGMFISDAVESIFGYPASDFALGGSRTFASIIYPEDLEMVEQVMDAAIRERQLFTLEYRIVHIDGSLRWVYEKGQGAFGTQGELLYLDGVILDISDRKRAEQERDRFFNYSLDLMAIADFNSRIRQVNPAWKKTLGFSQEELEGKPISEFIHPEDLDATKAVFREEIDTCQSIIHFENRYRCKDGSYRWLAWNLVPFPDEGLSYGFAHDITKRKHAEETLQSLNQELELRVQERTQELIESQTALQNQTRILQAILDSMGDGVVVADPDGRLLVYNPAAEKILGTGAMDTSPEEWSAHYGAFLPDKLTPYPVEQLPLARAIRGEVADAVEIFIRNRQRPQGVHVETTVRPLKDEMGVIKGGISVFRDITQRKRTEAALRESEERFRTSVENMLDAFAIFSAVRDESGSIVDFQFEYVNRSACVSNQMTSAEILGKSLSELRPNNLENRLFEAYCQVVETGQPLVKEAFYYEGVFNGQPINRAFDFQAMKLGDGFAVAWRDVTERQRSEEQIRASLREKETLLQEIHHRVKNNLQVISSLLRLQSKQVQDQHALQLFKESQNRVQAMALIHQKLYQSSNLAEIGLQDYIKSLVQELSRSYDAHRRAITLKVNVGQVSLAIDSAIPCGLIINELVSNSLKHAFPNHQEGKICLCLEQRDSSHLLLTISDNGIGIPLDLDFRNTPSLGLQLVCRLTKQLEGSIELNRSQGTEFRIALTNRKSR